MLYLYPGVIVMDIVLFCMKLSNKGPLWVLSTHYLSATYDGQLKQWCHHLYTKISHVLKLNILLMKTSMAVISGEYWHISRAKQVTMHPNPLNESNSD